LTFHKVQCLFSRDTVDVAVLVPESDTIALVRNKDNLGSERGTDELRTRLFRDGVEKTSDSRTVLGVQIGVHLIKNDHGTGLCLLKCKDQAESTQTWQIMLVAAFMR
jgi:hypothetical protein